MNAPASPRTLADVAQQPLPGSGTTDVTINMFSAQGFALAQRLANAYQSSNAVPAVFRSVTTKREKRGEDYVDVEIPNPSAMGNCIVAIETAQAVGMSITAVMQNANIIEGRLTWSGKFVIAAINASGRFSPLRFRITNKGLIKATYKEKGEWNKQARKYNMIEREIEVENIECVAWAYVMQGGRRTDEVIEGAPVSIKMAVEEGWYSKPGSKWQTEMKHLMLQYRAGSFFGNIHAPDVVMGMGRTTEEALDTIDAVTQPDGSIAVDVNALRTGQSAAGSTASKRPNADATDVESKDQKPTGDTASSTPSQETAAADQREPEVKGPLTPEQLTARLNEAKTAEQLEALRPLIDDVPDPDAETALLDLYAQLLDRMKRPVRAARGARPSVE